MAEGQRQADADLLPHRHRLRLARQARQGSGARRAAGRGRSRRAARRTGLAACAVRDPEEIRAAGAPRTRARCASATGTPCSTATLRNIPGAGSELIRRSRNELPDGFSRAGGACDAAQAEGPVVASRKASQMALEAFAPLLPELIGGSADLRAPTSPLWKGEPSSRGDDANANYIYFGVREFAMTAISNGLGLHGGFIPYCATFLRPRDYARNAVRMGALMGCAASTSTRTTPSAWAKTARPTSRSNTSPRCATSRNDVVAPVRRGRIGGRVEAGDRTQRRPELPGLLAPEPGAPGAQRGSRSVHRARRLRPAGFGRRAGADPHRHRFRSRPRHAGRRAARRRRLRARRVDAVHRRLRPPGRRVSRIRAADDVPQARCRSKPASRTAGGVSSAREAPS